MSRSREIEKSITKNYRGRLWSRFLEAVKEYELIKSGDKIAVCVSGGKDSMCLAKMMQILEKDPEFSFEAVYLCMDPGFSKENRLQLEKNAEVMGVPLILFDTDFFSYINTLEGSPCYMCAKLRRGALYEKARELGCNKIALGHHQDDVIETTLLSLFYASKLEAMRPKLHAQNFEGMELIRPMYCVKEADIIRWAEENDLHFLNCACKFTQEADETVSKRKAMKKLIAEVKKENPDVDKSIFNGIHQVCIDTFPAYKKGKEIHSFLEEYDKEKDK